MARRCGPAQLRGVAWNGAGGSLIFSQSRQVIFSRTCWITFPVGGGQARLQGNVRPPTHRRELGTAHQFAWSSVRLAAIEGNHSSIPHGIRNDLSQQGLARHEIKGEEQVKPLLSLIFWVST
jgi:hypothetical protein